MPQLETRINTRSDEFQANRESMVALVADLREKVAGIAEGGGERAREIERVSHAV